MKKNKVLLVILLFPFFGFSQGPSESMKDSVEVLYKKYFELKKSTDSIQKSSASLVELQQNLDNFKQIVTENNRLIGEFRDDKFHTAQQQFTFRKNKIVNTSEFVYVANVSLNAIRQFDATATYLSRISALNNPSNTDLGFSLTEEVNTILKKNIIKGGKKINGASSDKFMSFMNNIIESPITEGFTSAVPVVGAIRSVIDIVIGTAVQGKDVNLQDVTRLKEDLKVYIEHYEGLAVAQEKFDQNLSNLSIRTNALTELLNTYTIERINTLSPNTINSKDTLGLTTLINKHYTAKEVQEKIEAVTRSNPTAYESHLVNHRLFYPDYALNQAKFIRDEVESLREQYILTFRAYQKSLEGVLNKSRNIGDEKEINKIISDLNRRLVIVEKNFNESVNVEGVNLKFRQLSTY
ncbi:hypothetical protein [Salinimicrobium xinjiangense]|uniref:hypothetical protein n=1 Tax=Salinimicrobium xinjiangense TaxID=438596 RepID=UPI0003FF4779|nr:hypothetical protein [Salinimicrobium xinjiangense]